MFEYSFTFWCQILTKISPKIINFEYNFTSRCLIETHILLNFVNFEHNLTFWCQLLTQMSPNFRRAHSLSQRGSLISSQCAEYIENIDTLQPLRHHHTLGLFSDQFMNWTLFLFVIFSSMVHFSCSIIILNC